MSSPFYEYRAVVYLNNTGVSLLQKRCYRQAMETFCDAISVTKGAVPHDGTKQSILPLYQATNRESIDRKLLNAAHRLSNPIPSSASMINDLTIQVVSDNESALTGTGSFLLQESIIPAFPTHARISNKTIYLIRMEPVDQEVTNDRSVEAAICLYNYGQAYKCLSELESSAPYASSLREGVRQLLHLAFLLLSSSQTLSMTDPNTSTGMEDGNSSSNSPRAVLMTAMSLRSLLGQTLSETDLAQEQFDYYKQKFRSIFPFLCTLMSVEGQCKETAAGAA